MIIRASGALRPQIAPSARIAENAAVIGDVYLGENVNVWYGAVLRGDSGAIRIGDGSNIQDNCTLHCSPGMPLTVGRDAVIGHAAVLHGCTIEDGCLIGMGAVVLDGSVIGRGSIVGAGALVTQGKIIPPGSLVLGVPGTPVRQVSETEQAETLENAAHYVSLSRQQLEAAESEEES